MLSVVIPARDVARFVVESVRSALAQTVSDLEVLVVDDGSRDDTRARVATIADPRLRLIDGPGRGTATARNLAMARARGDALAFLDADDVWLPDHLERLRARLERSPELDLVFAAAAWIDEDGRPLPRTVVRWDGPLGYRELFREFYPVTASTLLVRRSAVERAGGFDEDMRLGADHDLCLRVALLRAGNCAGVPQVGVRYRRRPGQNTADRESKLRYWQKLVAKHRSLAPAAVDELEAVATALHERALFALAYESGELAEARTWLGRALRTAPLALARDRRTWLAGAAAAASWLPAPGRRWAERVGAALLGALPSRHSDRNAV